MKAERFPANVLNVTLFGKQCDWHPYPTVQNWKDSCEKELDLGGFPWTQIFNAKFSGKKVYCSKAYSEQEPFCMLQLLAHLAFFTSTLNPTAFLSWAERFPVRCIWGPKLPLQNIRYNQWVSPAWAGFMLDPVMPGTGRSPNGTFCFPLQGQLWRLVGAAGHLLILAQQSPEGAQMSTWMCPFTSIIVSSLPFHTPSAASQIFALKAPNLLLMLL